MSEPNPGNMTVLVIDDEAFARKIVAQMLNDGGYKRIIEAEDAIQGADQLCKSSPQVDVALVDLNMPRADGFDFITFVRKSGKAPNAELPIIVLTGNSERDRLLQAARLGIHGFLVKPVSKKRIDESIKHAMRAGPIDHKRIAEN